MINYCSLKPGDILHIQLGGDGWDPTAKQIDDAQAQWEDLIPEGVQVIVTTHRENIAGVINDDTVDEFNCCGGSCGKYAPEDDPCNYVPDDYCEECGGPCIDRFDKNEIIEEDHANDPINISGGAKNLLTTLTTKEADRELGAALRAFLGARLAS